MNRSDGWMDINLCFFLDFQIIHPSNKKHASFQSNTKIIYIIAFRQATKEQGLLQALPSQVS